MKVFQGFLIASVALGLVIPNMGRAEDTAASLAAYQPCIACHGDVAQGNTSLGAPALAGQGEAYLARQLQNFKTGVRGSDDRDTGGAQMKAMAVPLSDEEIASIAAYLSGLSRPVLKDAISGDLKNGNNYFQGNCGACHGGKAEGNAALGAPALAGLDAAYLRLQYRNFGQGIRGTHPDDSFGVRMRFMAKSLPRDKDLDDVIAYIQSLAVSP